VTATSSPGASCTTRPSPPGSAAAADSAGQPAERGTPDATADSRRHGRRRPERPERRRRHHGSLPPPPARSAVSGVPVTARAGHRASPCPTTALPTAGQPFAQAMKRSVVAFPPKGARSKRRASLFTSAMGIQFVCDLLDAHVDPALVHGRLQVDVTVDVHAAGGDVVQGHVREE